MKAKKPVTGGSNMNAKLRNGMLALGGALLFAAPALAFDVNEGDFGGTYRYIGPGAASDPDIYVGPAFGTDAYAPDIYAPKIQAPEDYAAPYAAVPRPDMAGVYIGPPYAPPPEAYLPPPVEDYAPGEAIVVGD
jgi:hypothetical protein